MKILKDTSENQKRLESLFATSADVRIESLESPDRPDEPKMLLAYAPGLCDLSRLEEIVLPKLRQLLGSQPQLGRTKSMLSELALPSARAVEYFEETAREVFQGRLVVISAGVGFSIDICGKPNRSPDDSKFEVSLFGPRDGFIEDLTTNVALVRKRLNSLSLCVEEFAVGELNQTRVCLLYMDGRVNKSALEEFRARLISTKVEIIESNVEYVEMLGSSRYNFMPKYRLTGRPDFVMSSLRKGKFAVLVDGIPSALLAPINLSFMLTTADDPLVSFPFIVFERFLRYAAFVIALLAPGFYVGITSLHPDQVPLSLLATLVNSRMGLPLPTPLEAFLMLILFEIFKESGTHLPQPAGNTLSVVGGLIIGDAAIRAGMASPALVVVVSASAVSLYAVTNHALASIISILRLGILGLSSFFGLYGFILSCIFVTVYFSHVRSFGMPFLGPLSPFRWQIFKQTHIAAWPKRERKRV
ncbi:spore germination protein [Alicyclobacillus ferrooxydans]|nr:spore germination protein [Alicyclobacillus ferrooxydans]